MVVDPDLPGFREAQVLLRQKFGEDVPFFTPTETKYPSGTPLDPESGLPYDPTVLPEASGFASASVRASVVFRPIQGLGDSAKTTPIGDIEEGRVVVMVSPEDFEEEDLEDATELEVHGERYRIKQTEYDQLGDGPAHRVIVHGEEL